MRHGDKVIYDPGYLAQGLPVPPKEAVFLSYYPSIDKVRIRLKNGEAKTICPRHIYPIEVSKWPKKSSD